MSSPSIGTTSRPAPRGGPERWLFWTVDKAAALMGPAPFGPVANQFVPGLIAGGGGWVPERVAVRLVARGSLAPTPQGHNISCRILVREFLSAFF